MTRAWILGVALAGAVGCNQSASSEASPQGGDAAAKPEASPKAKATAEPEPTAAKPVAALPEPRLISPLGEPPPREDERIVVQLPPPPDFESEAVPDLHPDGSHSIAGLRRELDDRVRDGDAGKEVVVSGWVSKIYVPPPCPEGEVCPPAKQAHVWITDTPDEPGLKRAMLVVGFKLAIPEWEAAVWKGQPEVVLELGKRYAFKGKFRQHTDMGFSHDDGLLEFVAVRSCDESGTAVGDYVYPPGAPWHPLSIAQQEEAERVLRARAGG